MTASAAQLAVTRAGPPPLPPKPQKQLLPVNGYDGGGRIVAGGMWAVPAEFDAMKAGRRVYNYSPPIVGFVVWKALQNGNITRPIWTGNNWVETLASQIYWQSPAAYPTLQSLNSAVLTKYNAVKASGGSFGMDVLGNIVSMAGFVMGGTAIFSALNPVSAVAVAPVQSGTAAVASQSSFFGLPAVTPGFPGGGVVENLVTASVTGAPLPGVAGAVVSAPSLITVAVDAGLSTSAVSAPLASTIMQAIQNLPFTSTASGGASVPVSIPAQADLAGQLVSASVSGAPLPGVAGAATSAGSIIDMVPGIAGKASGIAGLMAAVQPNFKPTSKTPLATPAPVPVLIVRQQQGNMLTLAALAAAGFAAWKMGMV